MKYARAPIFRTVSFVVVEPLVACLNGRDHDYSPGFAVKRGLIRCPPPGRSTVMEIYR
jgi:hypothetical protein